jgi:Lon protease-like protein
MTDSSVTPMFPLESALLPGEELPLRIFEPRYSALVGDCLDSESQSFGVVLIAAGREVGGGDARFDIGVLARIVEHRDFGEGRYALRCELRDRIRILQWLDDDPYPRASVEPWPDQPGEAVTGDRIGDVEDRIMAVFERIATARGAQLPSRYELLGDPEPGEDAGTRLYSLASRVPMGQADRYSVLSAPTAAARLTALSEAVDTVSAMVDFQLSGD